jgi:hypothetical protein
VRTTLSIDDDVLEAVKERAKDEGRTAGEVLSDLARRELTRVPEGSSATVRNGFPLLPRRGKPVTNTHIDRLRDEEGV